jgi:hypothetical protein
MPTSLGNGSIVALDLATGVVKWEHKMIYPNWVSPLGTNGIIFTCTVTDAGKNYSYNEFRAVTKSPLMPTGILMALDATQANCCGNLM